MRTDQAAVAENHLQRLQFFVAVSVGVVAEGHREPQSFEAVAVAVVAEEHRCVEVEEVADAGEVADDYQRQQSVVAALSETIQSPLGTHKSTG